MLKAGFFAKNRKNLSKMVGGGLIIITASSLLQRTGDSVYTFRQDSNFFYLTGLKEPDLLLVLDGKEEFLVLPKRSYVEEIFGGTINRDNVAKLSGIKKIYNKTEGWVHIKKLIQRRRNVHTLMPPARRVVHTDAFSTNPNRRFLVEKLKRLQSSTKFIDLRTQLTDLRQIKQPEEVAIIKKAIEITARGLDEAKKMIEVGINGYQLKAELDKVFTANGCEHGFTPIVTSGFDTSVMHSLNYAKQINNGEPILFDIGAEAELYTADITRMYFCGQESQRYLDVYNAVKFVKSQAEKLVKPGLAWRDWAINVDEIMGQQLINLGLINTNKRPVVRKYFSHAIGHSLGLDAHDVCDYMQPIKPGMVMTIEPGIYIPEEGFGVRIEDDYLVTKTGIEKLSKQILL